MYVCVCVKFACPFGRLEASDSNFFRNILASLVFHAHWGLSFGGGGFFVCVSAHMCVCVRVRCWCTPVYHFSADTVPFAYSAGIANSQPTLPTATTASAAIIRNIQQQQQHHHLHALHSVTAADFT